MPKTIEEIRAFTHGIVSSPSLADIPKESASYSLNIDANGEQGALKGLKESMILSNSGWNEKRFTTYQFNVNPNNVEWSEIRSYLVDSYRWFIVPTYGFNYFCWFGGTNPAQRYQDISNSTLGIWNNINALFGGNLIDVKLSSVYSNSATGFLLSMFISSIRAPFYAGPTEDSFLYNNVNTKWFEILNYEKLVAETLPNLTDDDTISYSVEIRSNFYGLIQPLNLTFGNWGAIGDPVYDVLDDGVTPGYFNITGIDNPSSKGLVGSGTAVSSDDTNISAVNYATMLDRESTQTLVTISKSGSFGVIDGIYSGTTSYEAIGSNVINDGVNNISSQQRNNNLYFGMGSRLETVSKWFGKIKRRQLERDLNDDFVEDFECIRPRLLNSAYNFDNIVIPTLHGGMNSTNSMVAGAASLYGGSAVGTDFGGADEEADATLSHYRSLNGWVMKCLANAGIAFQSNGTSLADDDDNFDWSSVKRGMILRVSIGEEASSTSYSARKISADDQVAGEALFELRRLKKIGYGDIDLVDEGTEGIELHDGDLFQIVTVPSSGDDTLAASAGDVNTYPRLMYVGSLSGNSTEHNSTDANVPAPAWSYGHFNDDTILSRIALSECNDDKISSDEQFFTFSAGGSTGSSTSNELFKQRITTLDLANYIQDPGFRIGTIAECMSTDGIGGIAGRVGDMAKLTISSTAHDADAGTSTFTLSASHSFIAGDWILVAGIHSELNMTHKVITATSTTLTINTTSTETGSGTLTAHTRNYYAGHGKLWVTSSDPNMWHRIYLIDVVNWMGLDTDNPKISVLTFDLEFDRIHSYLKSSEDNHGLIEETHFDTGWVDDTWSPHPAGKYISGVCETYSHQPHLDDGASNATGKGRWRVWLSYSNPNGDKHLNWDLFLFNFRPTDANKSAIGGDSLYLYDKTPPYQQCGKIKNFSNEGIYFPRDKFMFSKTHPSSNVTRLGGGIRNPWGEDDNSGMEWMCWNGVGQSFPSDTENNNMLDYIVNAGENYVTRSQEITDTPSYSAYGPRRLGGHFLIREAFQEEWDSQTTEERPLFNGDSLWNANGSNTDKYSGDKPRGGPMFRDPSGFWHFLEIGHHDPYDEAGESTENSSADRYAGRRALSYGFSLGYNLGWYTNRSVGPTRHCLRPHFGEWYNTTTMATESAGNSVTDIEVSHIVAFMSKVTGNFVRDGGEIYTDFIGNPIWATYWKVGKGKTESYTDDLILWTMHDSPVAFTSSDGYGNIGGEDDYISDLTGVTDWSGEGSINEVQGRPSGLATDSSGAITEQITDSNNRVLTNSSTDWVNGSGSNAFNTYTEGYNSMFLRTEVASGQGDANRRWATLDEGEWASGMVVGTTYVLRFQVYIPVAGFDNSSGNDIHIGFADDSYALQSGAYLTVTSYRAAWTNSTVEFTYTADMKKIIVEFGAQVEADMYTSSFTLKKNVSDMPIDYMTDNGVYPTLGYSKFNQYRYGHDYNGTRDLHDDSYTPLSDWNTWKSYKGADGFGHYNMINQTWNSVENIHYRGRWNVDQQGASNPLVQTTDSTNDIAYGAGRHGKHRMRVHNCYFYYDMTDGNGNGYSDDYHIAGRNQDTSWNARGFNTIQTNANGHLPYGTTIRGGGEGTGYFTWYTNSSDHARLNYGSGGNNPDGTALGGNHEPEIADGGDAKDLWFHWDETNWTNSDRNYYADGIFNTPSTAVNTDLALGEDSENGPDMLRGNQWDNRRIVFCWSTMPNEGGMEHRGWKHRKAPKVSMRRLNDSSTRYYIPSNELEYQDWTDIWWIDNISVYDKEDENAIRSGLLFCGTTGEINGVDRTQVMVSSMSRTKGMLFTEHDDLWRNASQKLNFHPRPFKKTGDVVSRRIYNNTRLVIKNTAHSLLSVAANGDYDIYCPVICGDNYDNSVSSLNVWRRGAWPTMDLTIQGLTKPHYNFDRFYNYQAVDADSFCGLDNSGADKALLINRYPTEVRGSTVGTNNDDTDTTAGVLTDTGIHKKIALASSILTEDGEEGNTFEVASILEYKFSWLYDGFQDSPLSRFSHFHTVSVASDTIDVEIKLSTAKKLQLNRRITDLVVWRRNVSTDEFRLVKQINLHTLGFTSQDEEENFIHRFVDDRVYESYENLTGISSTLETTSVNFSLSAAVSDFMFVGNCYHKRMNDAQNVIFRSQAGKFSIYDWSNNFLALPTRPLALASFGGKLYAFSRERLYRINPEQFFIESVMEGIGILNQNSVSVTDFGMFFCDANNMYQHDGTVPKAIGNTVLDNQDNVESSVGYRRALDKAILEGYSPIVQFDGRNKCVYFIVRGYSEGLDTYVKSKSRAYCYSISTGRFDYVEMDSAVIHSVLGRDGDTLLFDSYQIYSYRRSQSNSKKWSWNSMEFDFGSLAIDKVFKSIKLSGSPNVVDLDGTSDDDVKVYIDGIQKSMTIQNKHYSISKAIASSNVTQNYYSTDNGLLSGGDLDAIYAIETALPGYGEISDGLTNTDAFSISTSTMPEFVYGEDTIQYEAITEGEISTLKYIGIGQYLVMEIHNALNGKSIKEIVKVSGIHFYWNNDNTISRVEVACERGELDTKAFNFESVSYGLGDGEWKMRALRYVAPSLKFPRGSKGRSMQIKFQNQEGTVDSITIIYRRKSIK